MEPTPTTSSSLLNTVMSAAKWGFSIGMFIAGGLAVASFLAGAPFTVPLIGIGLISVKSLAAGGTLIAGLGHIIGTAITGGVGVGLTMGVLGGIVGGIKSLIGAAKSTAGMVDNRYPSHAEQKMAEASLSAARASSVEPVRPAIPASYAASPKWSNRVSNQSTEPTTERSI